MLDGDVILGPDGDVLLDADGNVALAHENADPCCCTGYATPCLEAYCTGVTPKCLRATLALRIKPCGVDGRWLTFADVSGPYICKRRLPYCQWRSRLFPTGVVSYEYGQCEIETPTYPGLEYGYVEIAYNWNHARVSYCASDGTEMATFILELEEGYPCVPVSSYVCPHHGPIPPGLSLCYGDSIAVVTGV